MQPNNGTLTNSGAAAGGQGYFIEYGSFGPGNYTFRVRSYDASGNLTQWSQPASGTWSDKVDTTVTPAVLSVSSSGSSITVTWQHTDGSTGVGPLLMQQDGISGDISQGVFPVAAVNGSYDSNGNYTGVISNLTPGVRYDFCLWTEPNDVPEEPAYSRASIVVGGSPSGTVPAAPAKLFAAEPSVTTGNVLLHWINSSNNEDSFVLLRSLNGGSLEPIKDFSADETSYTDSSIPYDKNGSATVVYAIEAVREGQHSSPTSIEILPVKVAVTSIQVDVTPGTLMPAPQGGNYSILNSYFGYRFSDKVTVYGTHLEYTQITQLIYSATAVQLPNGSYLTYSQIQQQSPKSDPNVLNTEGATVTDTDWQWQPYAQNSNYGHLADNQSYFVLPLLSSGFSLLSSRFLDFTLEVALGSDHSMVLDSHDWGYTWSNSNLRVVLNPSGYVEAEEFVGSHKGVFSDVHGINGLTDLN